MFHYRYTVMWKIVWCSIEANNEVQKKEAGGDDGKVWSILFQS